MSRERHILEKAVRMIAEQATAADALVDHAMAADSDDLALKAKMLRQELLDVKRELERELETFSLDCRECSRDVHWVSGLGVTPGH